MNRAGPGDDWKEAGTGESQTFRIAKKFQRS
jgi:hypothetical protein